MMEKEPLVSILLAVYKPQEDYLSAQMRSLAALHYENLEIIACDDSDDDASWDLVSKLAGMLLSKRRCRLIRNGENLGSNETFARLTEEASGRWLAYCDQDDIWEPDKIGILLELAERTEALLVYSDLSLIDGQDQPIGSSFWAHRGIRPLAGESCYRQLIRRNCVTGCAMLVDAVAAKAALPFPSGYIHDHWLALHASVMGKLAYTDSALVRYRLHGANQVGAAQLAGIITKEDYIARLEAQKSGMYDTVARRFAQRPEVMTALEQSVQELEKRIGYIRKPTLTGALGMWNEKSVPLRIRGFELLLGISGKEMAEKLLARVRR